MSSSNKLMDYKDPIMMELPRGGKSEGKDAETTSEPTGRNYIVKVTMYFFGISCLLPWNFFIQANDYWLYKFRNVTADGNADEDIPETQLQINFPSYMAIASKTPYVLFLLVNAVIANRIQPEKRMQYPLIIMIVLFIVVVIMVPINSDNNQMAFFAVTICIIVGINIMCGFVQGAGTGIAGAFPKRHMDEYVNGMAVGGVLASFAQILSLVGDNSPVVSAIAFFICATVFLCITLVLFRILMRMDYYKYYMSKQSSAKPKQSKQALDMLSHWTVFKKVWVYAVSLTVLFWVTLSLLPGIVSQVTSSSNTKSIWTGRLFLPVACFFLFNACDLGGRILGIQMPIPSKYSIGTMLLTISRVVFVPLIMYCNTKERNHLPVIFDSDISFIIIIFFFAITNGYLCNVILAQAPKKVEQQHQELAGTQMAFFLGFGLMLGSLSSLGILKLL